MHRLYDIRSLHTSRDKKKPACHELTWPGLDNPDRPTSTDQKTFLLYRLHVSGYFGGVAGIGRVCEVGARGGIYVGGGGGGGGAGGGGGDVGFLLRSRNQQVSSWFIYDASRHSKLYALRF